MTIQSITARISPRYARSLRAKIQANKNAYVEASKNIRHGETMVIAEENDRELQAVKQTVEKSVKKAYTKIDTIDDVMKKQG